SGLQDEQVAWNDVGGGDPDDGALAANEGFGNRQCAQLRQRDARPPLREEADSSVEQEGGENRDRLDALPERRSDHCRGEEQQDDETAKLSERETPEWCLGMLAHHVG